MAMNLSSKLLPSAEPAVSNLPKAVQPRFCTNWHNGINIFFVHYCKILIMEPCAPIAIDLNYYVGY